MYAFDTNSRIKKVQDGIKFYEQDIFCSNYVFAGDQEVELVLDYLVPGFGIVLMENSSTIRSARNATLFRLGDKQFTGLYKSGTDVTEFAGSSSVLEPGPDMKDIHLHFTLRGAKATFIYNFVDSEGEQREYTVGQCTMPKEYVKYRIGFYSNAGNILKSAIFKSGVPKNWNVNIGNTCGGRISFYSSSFQIENCDHDAELEQDNIHLEPGTYYLDFEREDVNGMNDIECYVFPSNADARVDERNAEDDYKNILKDNSFTVKETGDFSLKFTGSNGKINNICIKDTYSSSYVETEDEIGSVKGSWISVIVSEASRVQWKGLISAVPQKILGTADIYAIVETNAHKWSLEELLMETGRIYDFNYEVETERLTVIDSETQKLIQDTKLSLRASDKNSFKIFHNVKGVIYSLVITDLIGQSTDVLIQKTMKKMVPADINSPIIVSDTETGESLDISSSYREVVQPKQKFLLFTREQEIKMDENIPINSSELSIYGAPSGAAFNMDSETIDEFAPIRVELDEADWYRKKNIVYIAPSLRDKYKYFILEFASIKDYSYVFTNYEREIFFDTYQHIVLEKPIAKINEGIAVYGIKEDAVVYEENMYRVPSKNMMNSIDYYSEDYDIIPTDKFEIDFNKNEIILHDTVRKDYSSIVIDYLKSGSYAINYSETYGQYEVDISSEENHIAINYDMEENGTIQEYKFTDILPDKDKYVVLRRKQ